MLLSFKKLVLFANCRLNLLAICDKIFIDAAITVGGLSFYGGTATLRLHRNPFWKSSIGWMPMTAELFLAILSFGIGTFALGYTMGQNHSKTQK